jgi:predicted transcriptional regulator
MQNVRPRIFEVTEGDAVSYVVCHVFASFTCLDDAEGYSALKAGATPPAFQPTHVEEIHVDDGEQAVVETVAGESIVSLGADNFTPSPTIPRSGETDEAFLRRAAEARKAALAQEPSLSRPIKPTDDNEDLANAQELAADLTHLCKNTPHGGVSLESIGDYYGWDAGRITRAVNRLVTSRTVFMSGAIVLPIKANLPEQNSPKVQTPVVEQDKAPAFASRHVFVGKPESDRVSMARGKTRAAINETAKRNRLSLLKAFFQARDISTGQSNPAVSDLARQLGLDYQVAINYITRLMEEKMLSRVRAGERRVPAVYEVTPEGMRALGLTFPSDFPHLGR